MISAINLILVLSALSNFLLSLFIFLKTKRDYRRIVLGMVSMVVSGWCFALFLYRYFDDLSAITFWGKMAHVFGAMLGPLFLMFVIFFITKNKIKKIGILYLIIILFILVLYLVLGTNLIIGGAYIKNKVNNMDIGSLYYLFVFYIVIHFSIGFSLLIYNFFHATGIEREQIKYILIGTILSSFTAVIFDLLYPIFYDFSLNWLGPVVTIIMVISMSYAIIKFRLMNIKIIITRGVLYSFLVIIVAAFFAGTVFLASTYLKTNNEYTKILLYIAASIVIVVFLDPLKNFFAKLTDRIFYKDRVDYQKLLQQASAVVAREIDLSKLAYSLSDLLARQLKVKEISAWIIKDKNWHSIASSQKHNSHLKLSEFFIKFINDRHDFIVVEELIGSKNDINSEVLYYKELNQFIEEAEGHKIEMIVPVFGDNGQLVSIFLFSGKSSGDLYGQDDINFFKVLSPQIGTAIEKSKLYEEVQEFNRELQAKVDARTKSLKEANLGLEQRNKFLIAMQGVTNMVSRTMDLKQVNQLIANSIATEFGYIGGILTFIDEKNNVLRIGAITENEYSNEVVKILGQDPKDFEAEMKMKDLLGVKTVLSGQMNTSDKMSDFFSPPVEKVVIDQIQEKLGVKTIVGLPIFSEDKIIGIVHFLLAVEESKFTSLDRDTMIALADQVGIVSRNLRLYNNLQATNQDLQVANMRLRELDQAKSEFLSIASHQLRTPISALKGYLSMISDGDFGTVPPKISKVVKDLFESAARLARLVNIFLNVSRIESGRLKIEKKPLQIGDMIESVIAELHNESDKKGVKLIYKKPKPALALVAADADKLREVVLNLIDNSIKYTPKGQIEVSALVENDNMHFKVQDTGIGIDPEEAKNLFRKFVRASGAAQIHTGGSGLGLFIAQKIIKEHGGQIWVESAGKEQGSIFQFVIPMIGGEPNKEEMQS